MNYHDVEQYSDEWWELRAGRFTASLASKIITPTGKPSAQYQKEIGRLIAEAKGWQEPADFVETEWMARGTELEDQARTWFCLERDIDVMNGGIITDGYFAASCDALTGYMPNPIPCEFKVPKPSTHIAWLIKGGLPDEHRAQVHFQMVVAEAPHAWFMSYHPEMEPLLVKVVADDYTENLRSYMEKAALELSKAYKKITGEEYETLLQV